MLTPFTQTKLKPTPMKVLASLDFFEVTKENYLSHEEKQKRLEAMNRVVLFSFLNEDLPHHLTQTEIGELEKMTDQIEKIDLDEVIKFLNQKVKNFMEILERKLLNLKKQLIVSHYKKLLIRQEKKLTAGQTEHFETVLNINKIVQAAEMDNWHLVEALAKHLPDNLSFYQLH